MGACTVVVVNGSLAGENAAYRAVPGIVEVRGQRSMTMAWVIMSIPPPPSCGHTVDRLGLTRLGLTFASHLWPKWTERLAKGNHSCGAMLRLAPTDAW